MASFPDSCIAITRGTSVGWRNRLTGTSWSSIKRSEKFCIWRGIITGTSTSWELIDKKPPLQSGIWGVLLGTKLTMNQVGHWHSWLPEGDCSNRYRRSSFLYTQHWWDTSGVLGPVLDSWVQERLGHEESEKFWRDWMSFMMRELGLFRLEKSSYCEDIKHFTGFPGRLWGPLDIRTISSYMMRWA